MMESGWFSTLTTLVGFHVLFKSRTLEGCHKMRNPY